MATKKLTTLDQLKKLAEKAKAEVDTLTGKISTLEGKGYQTKAEVEAAIKAQVGSVYKVGGSVGDISELAEKVTAENVGTVWNVSQDFTVAEATPIEFVESVEASYPAGTNVVCVEVGDDEKSYKLDVLAGFIDLSTFVEKTELEDYAKSADLTGYLKTSEAATTYLPTATAEADYLKKEDAETTYLKTATAETTYLKSEAAESTYAKKSEIPTEATSEKSGLMPNTDKAKLDGIEVADDTEVESMLTEVFSPGT